MMHVNTVHLELWVGCKNYLRFGGWAAQIILHVQGGGELRVKCNIFEDSQERQKNYLSYSTSNIYMLVDHILHVAMALCRLHRVNNNLQITTIPDRSDWGGL